MNTKAQVRTEGGAVEDAGNKLGKLLNDWMEESGPSILFKTCDNCKHMTENGPAFCNLWQQTPPASVIVKACPSHEDKEEIPF